MSNVFQYTVVVKTPEKWVGSEMEPNHYFRNWDNPSQVIEFVSKLNENLQVFAIYRVDILGKTAMMTVGFVKGRLELVEVSEEDSSEY